MKKDVKEFKSGFIAVAGLPNVGKSTLLNRLVGCKLAIVTPRPQTTRKTIRGISTTEKAQMIFLDTAGIHLPKDKLGKFMVEDARKSLSEADIIYLMVEPCPPGNHEKELVATAGSEKKTTFLIINKVDTVKRADILPIIEQYGKLMNFSEIIPLSASTGENTEKLVALTTDYLPESRPFFPEDIISDQIQREFISEFVRERVFLNTQEEIPYSSAVLIEDMQERENGGAYIALSIFVEKDSQKGIIIGKGGSMIKKIGQEARQEIEKFLGFPVYLDINVKVKKKWRKDIKALKTLGYK